jgi:hypothetical protein
LALSGPHVIGAVVAGDDRDIIPQQQPEDGSTHGRRPRRERVRALSARSHRTEPLPPTACGKHCGAQTKHGRCCSLLGIFAALGVCLGLRAAVQAAFAAVRREQCREF